ncbi:MAG: hypothetical protein WCV84_00505 [Patescibacteria group bacterium]
MFEKVKLGFYYLYTDALLKQGIAAKKIGKDQLELVLLKRAMQTMKKTLPLIPSGDIKSRAAINDSIAEMQLLYFEEQIQLFSAEDRELVLSALVAWRGSSAFDVTGRSVSHKIILGMFDLARRRLGDGPAILRYIYDGDHVPAPLRDIMQMFLQGKATHEETEQRLVACSERLKRLFAALFPCEEA